MINHEKYTFSVFITFIRSFIYMVSQTQFKTWPLEILYPVFGISSHF